MFYLHSVQPFQISASRNWFKLYRAEYIQVAGKEGRREGGRYVTGWISYFPYAVKFVQRGSRFFRRRDTSPRAGITRRASPSLLRETFAKLIAIAGTYSANVSLGRPSEMALPCPARADREPEDFQRSLPTFHARAGVMRKSNVRAQKSCQFLLR